MGFAFSAVLVVHVLVGLGVIGLVLLQHGKGADMGAAFGSGTSGSLFGASGSANFLSRTTAVLATVFFITSLSLSYLATRQPRSSGSVMEAVKNAPPAAPAGKPAAAPAGAPAGAPAAPASAPGNDVPK